MNPEGLRSRWSIFHFIESLPIAIPIAWFGMGIKDPELVIAHPVRASVATISNNIFFIIQAIKVELPVTGQFPCRSLRAAFPHRAPQLSCAVVAAL